MSTPIEAIRVLVGEPIDPPATILDACRKALTDGIELYQAEIFHYMSEALARQEGISKRSQATHYANLAWEQAYLEGNLVLAAKAHYNATIWASELVEFDDFRRAAHVFCDTVRNVWLSEAKMSLSSREILEIHSILRSLEKAVEARYAETVASVKN